MLCPDSRFLGLIHLQKGGGSRRPERGRRSDQKVSEKSKEGEVEQEEVEGLD